MKEIGYCENCHQHSQITMIGDYHVGFYCQKPECIIALHNKRKMLQSEDASVAGKDSPQDFKRRVGESIGTAPPN